MFISGADVGPYGKRMRTRCPQDAHRKLVLDGVLADGECSNPALACCGERATAAQHEGRGRVTQVMQPSGRQICFLPNSAKRVRQRYW